MINKGRPYRVKLSGNRPALYRFLFLPVALLILLAVGAFFTLAYLSGVGDLGPIILVFIMAIVVIVMAVGTREVYFDRDHLYVDRAFSTSTFDLKKVRRLKGCYNAIDWYFQIEFFQERGSILKIDYLPPRREARFFKWNEEFVGASKEFARRIKELQSVAD